MQAARAISNCDVSYREIITDVRSDERNLIADNGMRGSVQFLIYNCVVLSGLLLFDIYLLHQRTFLSVIVDFKLQLDRVYITF